ncbi:LPD29 domain-containing protein, partial [Desmospora activa]
MAKATEVAKKIRKVLKEQFPGTKFSVRTDQYSMGASIIIKWTNFPTEQTVDKVVRPYEQVSRDPITGDILSGGNLHISAVNKWTSELREEIEKEMPHHIKRSDLEYYRYFRETSEKVYERYRERIEAPTNRGQVMKDPEGAVTIRQKMALHRATGLNTTEWELTKAQAGQLISKHKKGQDITPDLEKMGLILPKKQPKTNETARRMPPTSHKKKKRARHSIPH